MSQRGHGTSKTLCLQNRAPCRARWRGIIIELRLAVREHVADGVPKNRESQGKLWGPISWAPGWFAVPGADPRGRERAERTFQDQLVQSRGNWGGVLKDEGGPGRHREKM